MSRDFIYDVITIIIIIINFLFTVGIKLIIAHTLKKSELIKTNYLT